MHQFLDVVLCHLIIFELHLLIEQFEQHCRATKEFYDEHATGEYITIHSWNEWTEGACLEPDTEIGYAYLDAIQNVFGQKSLFTNGD